MRTSKESEGVDVNADDKKMYIGVALFFGAAAIYLFRSKCSKACPGAVDQMIEMKGAPWKYTTLVEVFSQFGNCKDCVDYAINKFPQILISAPQNADVNFEALSEAADRHKIERFADLSINEDPSTIHASWTPSDSVVIAQARPGWRRAKQGEVSPQMKAAAIASLSKPIGSWIEFEDFAIALETHYNEKKGEHKGASIFVKQAVYV